MIEKRVAKLAIREFFDEVEETCLTGMLRRVSHLDIPRKMAHEICQELANEGFLQPLGDPAWWGEN